MTAKSRANLKAAFETGDTPTGRDFEDLIDSFATITDTTAQSLAANLTVPGVGANTVSGGTVYADNILGAGLSTHKNPYINAYADVTAQSSVDTTASWVQVSAALTATLANGFSVSGHDVTYTGSVTARFLIDGQIEARGSANQQIWTSITKNGTPLSGSITKRRGAADVVVTRMQTVAELKTNDIVSMRAQTPNGPIQALDTWGVKYLVTPLHWD